MLAPFLVECDAVLPHLFKCVVTLLGLIKTSVNYGDSEHHKQLMAEIFLKSLTLNLIEMAGLEALFGY